MRVLMSGASGLIGSALGRKLRGEGNEVVALVRRQPGSAGELQWNPSAPISPPDALENFDVVVHLAGESIMGLWTDDKKRRIRDSRLSGTTHLAEAIAALSSPPRLFISASATGYYGSRGDEEMVEESPPGTGFLADVCQEWEAATRPVAERAGIRLVLLRIGPVLTMQGGLLPAAVPAFKLGLGSTFGSGSQPFSWISLDDMVGAIFHIIGNDGVDGPVNMVAPETVTNAEFTQTLARVLRRPAFLKVPEFALRVLAREMAEEMLLGGSKVLPKKLTSSGYVFRHPDLEPALREILG